MFVSPFYIAEAKLPAGFPAPGKANEIVVKRYPAYRSASVQSSEAVRNGMFGSLFNHIKKNDIAMTAPVEMTYDDTATNSMAFLYASQEIGMAGHEGAVLVADHEPTQVVSIAIRGAYNSQRFHKYCDKLRKWIKNRSEWEIAGEPRYLAYNSPFVPSFLRYGEVQFPIKSRSEISF